MFLKTLVSYEFMWLFTGFILTLLQVIIIIMIEGGQGGVSKPRTSV